MANQSTGVGKNNFHIKILIYLIKKYHKICENEIISMDNEAKILKQNCPVLKIA